MPYYDFSCDNCGVAEHEFSMKSVPNVVKCDCGSQATRKYSSSWGSISSSDDPSRWSSSKRYSREVHQYGHTGWVDKVETGQKPSWEHAD